MRVENLCYFGKKFHYNKRKAYCMKVAIMSVDSCVILSTFTITTFFVIYYFLMDLEAFFIYHFSNTIYFTSTLSLILSNNLSPMPLIFLMSSGF